MWYEACSIEQSRAMTNKQHTSKRNKLPPEELAMKKWLRVKMLVNDGELSKAARDIDGAGVAEPTTAVVAELRSKYPKRRE